MSPWNTGQRGARPTDITWTPEDVELAPEWLREEILGATEELRSWLAGQKPSPDQPCSSKRRRGKRTRRCKE